MPKHFDVDFFMKVLEKLPLCEKISQDPNLASVLNSGFDFWHASLSVRSLVH
jgi:hypothetical protein